MKSCAYCSRVLDDAAWECPVCRKSVFGPAPHSASREKVSLVEDDHNKTDLKRTRGIASNELPLQVANDSSNKKGENRGQSPPPKPPSISSLGSSIIARVKAVFRMKPWERRLGDKVGVYERNLFKMVAESLEENKERCYLVVMEQMPFKNAPKKWWDTGGHGSYSVYYPRICPCCGDAADSSLSLRWAWEERGWGRTVTTLRSKIPYCKRCLRHKKYYKRLDWPFGCTEIGGAVCLLTGIMTYFQNDYVISIFCLVGVFLAVILAVYLIRAASRDEKRLPGGKCNAKRTAVKFWFHSKNEMQIYLFNNAKYTYEFAKMNESLAANVKIVEIGAEDLKA